MTVTSTGTASFNPVLTTSLASMYLLTPTPASIAQSAIMRATLDANSGDTLRFVSIPLFPRFPNAVGNNSSGPAPISPTYSNTDIKVSLFVQCVIFDTTTAITSQIDWIEKILHGQQVSTTRTEDLIVSLALQATANTIYAQGGSNGDSPTEMTVTTANSAAAYMENKNAPKTTPNIGGENKFGTNPVAGGFMMMTSTAGLSLFYNDPNFQPVDKYPDKNLALPEEVGTYGRLRLIASADWPIFTGGVSLLGNPILQGSVTSVQSYVIVMHPSMYHQITAVGSAFLGLNNLQVGSCAKNFCGTGIVQPDWVLNILYTAYAV